MVMPRTETMPGYNTLELDEVHTPSRYFAMLSFCSWEVHLHLSACSFSCCEPNHVSPTCVQPIPNEQASRRHVCGNIDQQTTMRTAKWIMNRTWTYGDRFFLPDT